jgi:hypothetical protein
VNQKTIIRKIRESYKKKLAEAVIKGALEEVDMYDDRGNMVLTKDLKVKHKASGYEYTVDHIEGDDEDAIVYLRHPEAPRVDMPDVETALTEKTKINIKNLDADSISGGGTELAVPETISLEKPTDLPDVETEEKPAASLVSVSKKEFEADYEVE